MGSEQQPDLGLVAKLASQGLFAPRSLSPDEIRAVCAIALMHVPDHRQVAMVAERPRYEQIDIALALVRGNDAAAWPMKHTVKFWDTSRAAPIPVAIDFLFAETLSDAVREAAKRLHILKNKYPGYRVGYAIEDEAGHVCRAWWSLANQKAR
jgi:hypothetical protein